jgi:non-specific serine/threonine protein kinase
MMTRTSTGSTGLDEMLEGGFPENRIILVRGGPGSGKTIFSLQFIVEGARKGERGVYVTFEEPLNLIRANVASFGWEMENFEAKGVLKLIDESQLAYKPPSSTKYGGDNPIPAMKQIANQIRQITQDFKAKRLAMDPITSAIIHQRYPTDKRLEILELVRILRGMQCTSIITSEFSSPSGEGDFYVEEYLADGVIVLSKALRDFNVIKTIRIEKMRGVRHDDQPRKYEIMDTGFVVYHTEPVTV